MTTQEDREGAADNLLFGVTCEVIGAWRGGTDLPAAMQVVRNLLDAAAQAERDAAVKWLREGEGYSEWYEIAHAIEAREHLASPPN